MDRSPKIALQLPIVRALAIMTTVGLGFVNLYYDAKEGSETYLRWGIAIAQFLTIGLLLFQSDPRLLGVAFGLALACTAVVWPRFASHESVRLPYIITQGVAAGLIGFMLFRRYWKLKKLQDHFKLRQLSDVDELKLKNMQETEKELKKQRDKIWNKKNRSDEEQRALEATTAQLTTAVRQRQSFENESSKRRNRLDETEKELSTERKALITEALGSDFSGDDEPDLINFSSDAVKSAIIDDALAEKAKVKAV